MHWDTGNIYDYFHFSLNLSRRNLHPIDPFYKHTFITKDKELSHFSHNLLTIVWTGIIAPVHQIVMCWGTLVLLLSLFDPRKREREYPIKSQLLTYIQYKTALPTSLRGGQSIFTLWKRKTTIPRDTLQWNNPSNQFLEFLPMGTNRRKNSKEQRRDELKLEDIVQVIRPISQKMTTSQLT